MWDRCMQARLRARRKHAVCHGKRVNTQGKAGVPGEVPASGRTRSVAEAASASEGRISIPS